MTYLFTEVLDGRNASLRDSVERALGRQPRDFLAVRPRGCRHRCLGHGRRPSGMMSTGSQRILTIVTLLGGGVVGGVFFAFSVFAMQALGRLPSREGIVAMQSINAAAPTPWFMTALFGTALASVALDISALLTLDRPGSAYQLVGCALYLSACW